MKLFSIVINAMAAICMSLAASAQAPQPPIEAYGELPSLVEAEVSPSGHRIALLVQKNASFVLRIYDAKERAITHQFGVEPMKVRGLFFSDDKHVILQASETTQTWGFRGKYEYSAAISINLENGKSKQMLSREGSLYPAQSGIGRVIGRLASGDLLMPAWVGSSRSQPHYDILKADPDNGHGRKHTRGFHDTIDWFVSTEGEALVRESYDDDKDKYVAEYHDGKNWNALLDIDSAELPVSIVALTNDEKGAFFVSVRDDEEGFSALSRINFDGSTQESTYAREGADIGAVLTDINRRFVGVKYTGTLPAYDFADEVLQESYTFVSSTFPNTMIELDSWADDRSSMLYRVFDGFKVDFWLLHQRNPDKLTILAYSRTDIPPEAVGQVFAAKYPARDGLDIPAILTIPPGTNLEAGMKLPMIVMPHGGPAAHDTYDFDWLAQFFANRGYFVLQPNFRGSTGFGQAFEDAGQGEWAGKMQDDITDGVNAMTSSGYADPDRVCIIGASYGGYAALAGGAFTPDLYRCVAAIAPVADLEKMLRTESRDHGRDSWSVTYWERIMADGDARREKLRSISPSEFADSFKAPVLLIHGIDDTVVEYDQSRIMKRALDRAGKDVDLVKLKGGDHWLSDSETRLATLQALDAFVSEHLAPAAGSNPAAAPTP
ncbi:S9 family peptidase [Henriciella mobilis]|uniref:alpha/beta hydrolase family protein n=1 Tax=Henriciella mobilis TaxID=2305467 RepID=UPI000E6699CA|nr:alpha/beta fold hydrolase [Henriciella mobilis]RIJ15596.1 S9 family peptidase [Henriciella mobilis]RIJ19060.1 S9 family peptidase [Henriciella mobilis]